MAKMMGGTDFVAKKEGNWELDFIRSLSLETQGEV